LNRMLLLDSRLSKSNKNKKTGQLVSGFDTSIELAF
ncbi:MAG: hypothetical protein ACI8Y3_000351, partial [Paraglaciecola sp.]